MGGEKVLLLPFLMWLTILQRKSMIKIYTPGVGGRGRKFVLYLLV